MPLLCGLDIGTTGCKSVIFDVEGNYLSSASREYTVDIPKPNWAEQDSERVWQLAQESLYEAISALQYKEIAAIGLSVQGEAVIPVNAGGNALRPAILGMDTRTDEQNDWIRKRFGAREIFDKTGMPVHTINTLPKLLWLKQNEPDLWLRAHKFLLYEDFLIQKMTGQPVISKCLASRTQLYDLPKGAWSQEILEAIGLDVERLATVKPSGTAIDNISLDLAEKLGLKDQPLAVTGGHDQACGALGVGLARPGLAMVSTGTAEVLEVVLSSPALNKTLYEGNISCYAHVVPDTYLAMTLNHSGGMVLRWFRDTFCQEEVRQAKAENLDPYQLILEDASPEPTSILLLPHFSGSGTPWFDTSSKGAILGLTFGTKKSDLAKAIMEGLTYELRINLDLLKDGNVSIEELRAIGGGAKSDLWLQLKADITGIPVVAPKITEAACWGAALLGGIGAGCFSSMADATEKTIHLERRFDPDSQRMLDYQKYYSLYREVYPSVLSIHNRLL